MRRRAFTFTELLVCMCILLALMSGIFVLFRDDSSYAAVRDMDRLARWLNHAFVRADRWKCGFYLSINTPSGTSTQHYMRLNWDDTVDSPAESFYADSRVRWSLKSGSRTVTYQWQTHSVSPAFVLNALDADGKLTGESLTVSVRALVTRDSS